MLSPVMVCLAGTRPSFAIGSWVTVCVEGTLPLFVVGVWGGSCACSCVGCLAAPQHTPKTRRNFRKYNGERCGGRADESIWVAKRFGSDRGPRGVNVSSSLDRNRINTISCHLPMQGGSLSQSFNATKRLYIATNLSRLAVAAKIR